MDEVYRIQAQHDFASTHLGTLLYNLGFRTCPANFGEFDLISSQLFMFEIPFQVETKSITELMETVTKVNDLDFFLYGS